MFITTWFPVQRLLVQAFMISHLILDPIIDRKTIYLGLKRKYSHYFLSEIPVKNYHIKVGTLS
jgi:hypothetical protein